MNNSTKFMVTLMVYMAFICHAQKDTTGHHGYLVTAQQDTIKGLIYNHHKYAHEYIVVKKINNTPHDSIFTPENTLLYTSNGKVFKTIQLPTSDEDTTYQFAEVLVQGPISLYMTKIKTDFILPPKHAYLAEKVNDHMVMPFGKITYILPLIQDYETLTNDILSYKYDSSVKSKKAVCDLYNEWVAKK